MLFRSMADGPLVQEADLPPGFGRGGGCAEASAVDLEAALAGRRLDEIESLAIRATLKRNAGHRQKTADSLGISERGLRNKIHEYHLEPEER